MRRIRWGATALLLALSIVATACGGSNTAGAAGGGGTGGDQAAAGPTSVSVTLSDFTIDPATITAPAGSAITFDVTNDGPSPHTFAVKAPDRTYDTGEIQPNATATLQVPALAAGSYEVLCTVSGHEQLGMKGTLTVGGAADASTTDGSGSMAGMPGMSGTGTSSASGATSPSMTAQQMADMHKAGVDAFLAGHQTKVQGGQVLEPTIRNGVKVFALTAEQVQWEVSKGQFVSAMTFNGTVPGPQLDVRYGDRIRIVVQNQMDQPTTVHFHGMTVPNAMDGVPYVTQDPIMPGAYFTYEFTVKDPPGMYVYHSHFNSTEQVGGGMYGAIMVEPQRGRWPYRALDTDPRTGVTTPGGPVHVDDEYTMFLGDGPLGYVIDGKSFPATTPLVAERGDWVLIHFANDGSLLHPMHLHGYHFEVVAQDGFPLEQPYMADTLVIAPGQRYDVLVHAVYPGAWAFHCHVLPHVEGQQGMFGMVTALVVQ